MKQPLRLMSTLAVEVALKRSLFPAWKRMGHEIEVIWNPTSVLMQRIADGERADVLILIDDPMAALAKDAIILQDTVRPIAQAGFGLAVRTGQAHPDISTPDRFRDALLAARSIAYSRTGASGIYFAELVRRLGIDTAVNERAVIVPAGFTAAKLLTGEADLAVQQISELMSVEGVEVVGPFPRDLQVNTDFSAGIFAEATQPELALRFLKLLTSREADEAYGKGGLASRLRLAELV